MLFLLRPRQSWLPFALPRDGAGQAERRQLQNRAVGGGSVPYAPPVPPTGPRPATDRLRDLGELHQDGALTDDEFAAAKAQVLGEK